LKPIKLKLNRVMEVGLILLSLTILGFVGTALYQNARTRRLTLAAGSPSGEGYIVCAALRNVVGRHNPRLKITLLETGGTVESLRMLEDGRADRAIAQADVPAGPSARIMAVLYDDTFQLLTRLDSPVVTFSGLRGKTIALPRNGGQFQSFLRTAHHFGLAESDFRFVGSDDTSADQAFADGRADAIFRVRALGNPSIRHLVETRKFRFVQLDHAAAMKIDQPAFEPSVIPAGAYLGSPAMPDHDLPTVSVHRTLLAASRVNAESIRTITGALIDQREEIAREIPDRVAEVRLLLAHVRQPDLRAELAPRSIPEPNSSLRKTNLRSFRPTRIIWDFCSPSSS
jgi:TRAP transporter TAXI family solute receptor